ncbi:AbrB/MazE/SpoVT family DNA-binding domain-containing protein [Sphingopyxis granuli]|jgi:AbrB family looped-hinge helix DNA binding protein|uniref:AbrB family transcriptional regulator n=1 Tax=Sphingopyxis granuli TaxID=267128 RepID=A0AA86L289_9SPHN|nr:AbrB/MazE/SpoVT family DNA-binding domain-containing protein [Sphingopyxis granuli]AMG73536.1 AbrB family transcriptional regulator [Sphingopyxis granuli]UNK80606.1 AbrB/MazE/SpoVT family DNA-binding domain-containing protein [Sphingopyxis granuli]
MSYHAKLVKGGKIVIPAELRRELNLTDGDTLVVERDGDSIVIKPGRQVLREIQAEMKRLIKKPFTVDDFIAERRGEAERE